MDLKAITHEYLLTQHCTISGYFLMCSDVMNNFSSQFNLGFIPYTQNRLIKLFFFKLKLRTIKFNSGGSYFKIGCIYLHKLNIQNIQGNKAPYSLAHDFAVFNILS